MSSPVADAYSHWATPFFQHVSVTETTAAGLASVSAFDVTEFLATHLPSMTRKAAQMTACALRSFLRFLHYQRILQIALADAVPAVTHRRLSVRLSR
ncbi:hypothetical protein GCM10009712_37500 [Pseudarthrobacter sulfonivorans]|uniref:hypothetical protein n=1 Tax=Pseudarthrobacter sulfonivorans TaxID=121292 RepID=UPI00168AF859|nr:hypothetical protein [Pseudarthrobacter sulfonivorans]